MYMVMVGIGSELPDQEEDQIELSQALVDCSDTLINTFNQQPYTYRPLEVEAHDVGHTFIRRRSMKVFTSQAFQSWSVARIHYVNPYLPDLRCAGYNFTCPRK
jgi:hypothetical protein